LAVHEEADQNKQELALLNGELVRKSAPGEAGQKRSELVPDAWKH